MKVLVSVLILTLLLVPCVFAQSNQSAGAQGKAIQNNVPNTQRGSMENQKQQSGVGFDTKASSSTAVKSSSGTYTNQQAINTYKAQSAAEQKATAQKYPAVSKTPPPSPTPQKK